MKTWLAFSAAVLPLFVLSCSSSSSSGAPSESFDDMFAAQAGGDATNVFGVWGASKNQQGYDIEQRLSLAADKVRLAQKCSAPDGTSDTVGVSSPATITADHAHVTESHTAQKQVVQAQCVVQMQAGDGAIAIAGGKLTFAGLTFDTKYGDKP
jgi:hypothetical protein